MARILLIEDDKLLLPLLSYVLRRAGHVVLEANTGQTGLDRARAEQPDLVVTDLIMPDKEGLETITELRRDFPDLPIIAMSGSGAGSHYLKAAVKLGAKATLTKPFPMAELVQAVAQAGDFPASAPAQRPLAFVVLDDDVDSRFLNRHALEKSFPGCVVLECTSVNDAVDKCLGQNVDAVLADHHLRGENGLNLVTRLRHQDVQCPILMVTANTDESTRQAAYAAGATEVFSDGNSEFIPYLRESLAKSAAPEASSLRPPPAGSS